MIPTFRKSINSHLTFVLRSDTTWFAVLVIGKGTRRFVKKLMGRAKVPVVVQRAKRKLTDKARRDKMLLEGLCYWCGHPREESSPSMNLCLSCHDKNKTKRTDGRTKQDRAAYERKRRAAKIAAGICLWCPFKIGKYNRLCDRCHESRGHEPRNRPDEFAGVIERTIPQPPVLPDYCINPVARQYPSRSQIPRFGDIAIGRWFMSDWMVYQKTDAFHAIRRDGYCFRFFRWQITPEIETAFPQNISLDAQ